VWGGGDTEREAPTCWEDAEQGRSADSDRARLRKEVRAWLLARPHDEDARGPGERSEAGSAWGLARG
jgi:hypothetical protein